MRARSQRFQSDLHKNGGKGKVLWKIQIFAEKNGPPNKNATFLTLEIQKLTEKVLVPPKTYLKTPSQRVFGCIGWGWCLDVLTHLRPDVGETAPSHESFPEFRNSHNLASAMTRRKRRKTQGVYRTKLTDVIQLQSNQTKPIQPKLMDHNHRKQQQPCFKSKDSSK